MIRILFLACINLINCLSLLGQDSAKCDPSHFQDALLDKLEGKWTLTGTIGKRHVENEFSAQWILNHQFMELKFVDKASPPTYMANVSIGYNCVSDCYVVHWLDNFGGGVSETLGSGVKKGETIEFQFEYPDGPFINLFSYDKTKDTWQFHMTQKNEKGEWVVFGDEYLKRRK